MELTVDFPGGARVDAHFGPHTVMTDQNGTAPSPFALFLASLGTCAGVYVLGFCRQRGLPTDGIRIVERSIPDPKNSGMVGTVELEIQVPPDFPKKYYGALVRSAGQCAVKKHLEKPPKFEIATRAVETA